MKTCAEFDMIIYFYVLGHERILHHFIQQLQKKTSWNSLMILKTLEQQRLNLEDPGLWMNCDRKAMLIFTSFGK